VQLNYYENEDQTNVSCAGMERGHYVCAWASYFSDGSGDGIKFRFVDR
jgi:hypothetical protein